MSMSDNKKMTSYLLYLHVHNVQRIIGTIARCSISVVGKAVILSTHNLSVSAVVKLNIRESDGRNVVVRARRDWIGNFGT